MATRLFSDLIDSAGRRYFFDLDSAPAVLLPGVGSIVLNGHDPQYPGSVFRTPATTVLILNGRSLAGEVPLIPAPAAVAFSNSAIGQLGLQLTISMPLESPDENPAEPFAPTIIYVNTITPTTGALSLIGYNHSLSEGGDIGFINPGIASLALYGYEYIRVIPPAPPEEGVDGQVGTATMNGLAPTLVSELVIQPEVGALALGAQAQRVDRGFIWIDDDPAPPLAWSE